MQGKPFFPAGLTAEGRPFILRLRDFHQGSAVAALEGPPDDDGADFLGVLPVQALAVSRTELDAPVRRLLSPAPACRISGSGRYAGLPFSATNGHDCSRRAGGRSGGSRNCSISA